LLVEDVAEFENAVRLSAKQNRFKGSCIPSLWTPFDQKFNKLAETAFVRGRLSQRNRNMRTYTDTSWAR